MVRWTGISVPHIGPDSLDEREHFRITLWPRDGIPLRERHRVHPAEVREIVVDVPKREGVNPRQPGTRILIPEFPERASVIHWRTPDGTPQSRWSLRSSSHVIPLGETYLKVAAIDLESRDAINAFLLKHGELGIRDFRDDPQRWLQRPFLEVDKDGQLVGPVFDVPILDGELPHQEWWDSLTAGQQGTFSGFERYTSFGEMARDAEQATGDPNAIPLDEYTYGLETLAEFQAAAGFLQDAVSLWRIAQGELDPHGWTGQMIPRLDLDAIATDALARAPEGFDAAAARAIGVKTAAMELVASLLEPGLGLFQPRLEIEGAIDRHLWGPRDLTDNSWFALLPLYSICCVELFNHISEAAQYRRCANERCQRLFVRQEGRATKGTRRSRGVLYCSAACAKAQTQREYRRRRAKGSPA